MTVPFLAGLGRRDDLDDELAQLDVPDAVPARVLAAHGGRWLVTEPTAAAAPRLVPARGRLRDPVNGGPPVTGDWVALDTAGAIAAVLARRGAVVRREVGERTAGQTLAANVDLALVVEPLPEPNVRRAERFVALAAGGGVPAALVLTKRDLDPDDGACAMPLARRLGLADALAVMAHDGGDGAALVGSLLAPGTTTVLLGPSGAGKSTLANALLGTSRQATGAVRDDGRGRHTTVARELLRLPSGALLIDTPGLREVGLWDDSDGAFADIEALAARCRFPDCGHESEPGCAVRDAVDPERLDAWRKLTREQAWLEDRRAAAREREQRGRSYSRIQREARRVKGDED
jgi:ribosome biogenesis GTPase / thiamine phosphate phosphatase